MVKIVLRSPIQSYVFQSYVFLMLKRLVWFKA